MQYLKADTAVKVVIGPVVAVGDGFTPVTTLSLSTADEAEMMKHDASAVTDISGNTFAAITGADGYYNLTLTAAQLDTEGMLTVLVNDDSLCLPVRHDFMVVNANVFDSLFAAATTDYLQVDVTQVGGAIEDIATETKQDVIDANVDAILLDTNELQTDDVPGLIAALNDPSAAAIADAVWDEVASGHLTAGTTGLYLALAGAVLQDTTITGTPSSTTFQLTAGSTTDDFYNDQLIYILSGTGVGQVRPILDYTGATRTVTVDEAWITTPAASDRVAILSTHVHPITQIADNVWDEATSGHASAGTTGKALTDILADTNEIQADWVDGGRLDLIIDELTSQGDTNEALISALNDITVADILTTQMTESYASDGAAPTLAQALFAIQQFLQERNVSGTTLTVRKIDGVTSAMTFTLNDGTSPTDITRAT